MRTLVLVLLAMGIGWRLSGTACSEDIFLYDFEQGGDPAKIEGLDVGKVEAALVEGGADGKGYCLRLRNPAPASSCSLNLTRPIEVKKNLLLAFDHKEEIEPGFEGSYLGMSFYVGGEQWFWMSDKFSGEWHHVEVPIGRLKSSSGKTMRLGLVLSSVQLYGRVKEKTAVKGETKARITVWFDNLRLFTAQPSAVLSERTRESYSNPPLFNWPKAEGEGPQRLQYSLDQGFPENDSVTVDVKWNFYTPPKPLKPGTYYWRVWSQGDLYDGWSEIDRVTVPPDVHQFTTQAVPVDEMAKKARPRLLELAKIGQPEVTEQRKTEMKASAKKLREWSADKYRAVGGDAPAPQKEYPGPDGKPVVLGRTGVQVHPGPHVQGDPHWPTWIDWYGRVAGGITGSTGRRLQTIAQYAMLTQDPEVIQWAKEMAIMACMWDPEGGSAMKRGDIGAHHLLRGLNWCYDVCRDQMTEQEREILRKIVLQRANQFWHGLNPFRGHEANNHAWLQALGLAESGLVLLGDDDHAAEWAEYVRQLYLGRFLCCLGYQGDNNEGIGYWGYGLLFIIDYADLMKAVCGINLYEHPWLLQTDRFPMYCAPPNAWSVSFADTGMPNHGVRGPAMVKQVRDLALRTQDPFALWYCGERNTVEGIVPRPPVDLPTSIHYRHIGVVIFNTSLVDGRDDVAVAMHSGKYFAGHQHPDQNSFVIHAYGEKLAIDGGYYDWYGSPHFKGYSMTTLAHNTLLVNGQGQAACKEGADGRTTAYFDSHLYGYTAGDASNPEIYGGLLKQFDRRILFIKPGFVVIHDMVAAAKEPSKYDWMLHAVAPIQCDKEKKSFAVECKDAALRGRFFAPAGVGLEVKTGFPVEPVNRYSTAPVPKENYFPEWILYATPEKPMAEEEFLAAMQVQRLGAEAEPVAEIEPVAAENAWGVRIKAGDRTHIVLFRKRGATGLLKCEGLECDGDAAAVEVGPDGKVKRSFGANTKLLRYNGQTFIEGPKAGDSATFDMNGPKSGPIQGAWASVNEKKSDLQGYELAVADDLLRYWWGSVELPQPDRYEIALEGWTGKTPPRLSLDSKEIELTADPKPHCTMWLKDGPRYLMVAGRGGLVGVTMTGQGMKLIPATMLPKEFKPQEGSLVIEAEKPSAEGEVKGKLMEKVGASGKMGHCCWDTEGQWAEWTFEVTAAGDYELLIRGAGEDAMVLREVKIDGKPLSPEVGAIRMGATGGWCRKTDDWRYFQVVDAKGRPARVHLDAGKHVLRIDQRGGSMNLDLFAWQPAP